MAKTRKPSRKELKKDDEFVVKGREVVEWASQYARPLMALGVGLVLVVAISIVTTASSRSKEAAGATALGAALEISERPVLEAEEGTDLGRDAFPSEAARTKAFREALEGVRKEHARTAGGALAALYLGKIALEEESYDDASTHFERYLAEAPRNHKMRFSALEGIGVALESTGDLEAALDAYRRLAREAPSFYVGFGMLHEARLLHALGHHHEARAKAERILEEHGGTAASRRARELLGRLPPSTDEAAGVAAAEAQAQDG